AFTVARRSFDDRVMIGHSRLLGCARDAVYIGHKSDDGLAGAVACDPGSGYSHNPALNFESVFLQNIRYIFRRLVLLKSKLAITEYLIDHLLCKSLHFIYFTYRLPLQVVQLDCALSAGGQARKQHRQYRKK